MKLQIIVPHYNEPESMVKRFLDSIAIQAFIDFSDFEVLVINDGDEYKLDINLFEQYRFPIKYYVKQHVGASDTREFGTRVATADYIMYCDCDDLFNSCDAIWRILQNIENNDADLICSSYIRDDETTSINNPVISRYTADKVKTACMIHGKVFKRQFIIDNNIHWPAKFQNRHEDFYFYSIVLAASPSVSLVEQEIYVWKYRNDSLSDKNKMDNMEQEIDRAKVELAVLYELKARGADSSFKLKLIDLLFNTYCYYHIASRYNRFDEVLSVAKETYTSFSADIAEITQVEVIDRVSKLGNIALLRAMFADMSFAQWINYLGRL